MVNLATMGSGRITLALRYDRLRHAGKKWRGEIDHPWNRG